MSKVDYHPNLQSSGDKKCDRHGNTKLNQRFTHSPLHPVIASPWWLWKISWPRTTKREEKVYYSSFRTRNASRDSKQKPWRVTACWLTHRFMLSSCLFFLSVKIFTSVSVSMRTCTSGAHRGQSGNYKSSVSAGNWTRVLCRSSSALICWATSPEPYLAFSYIKRPPTQGMASPSPVGCY